MTRPVQFPKQSPMLMLASIAALIAALYLAKDLLAPLSLAVLLSFLLIPACDWFERRGLGRVPAVLVTVTLAFSVLSVVAWTAVLQMTELAPNVSEYQGNIQLKLQSLNDYATTVLNKVTRTAQEIGQDLDQSEQPTGSIEQPLAVHVVSPPSSPLKIIGGIFGPLLKVLGSTGVVIILVVFFLIRREDLRDRFIRLIGRGQATTTIQTLEDAATRLSRYLLMQLFINVTFGVSVAIGLLFIGLPNAILWGILATGLRFIPYLGPWIAAAMPIGLSLAISTGWVAPMLTVGLFVALELFSNNVMEPWLYGKKTGVSAVAVLLAAIFWTWLWGGVGLFLATPLTVCLLVIGKHVPQLSFLDILLGNEPVFEPKTRVYQRLLAGDQEEASELVEGYLKQMPLVEVYDTLLIPALVLAQTDWYRGELDEARHQFVFQNLREIVEELGERQKETQARQSVAEAKETGEAPSPIAAPSPQGPCILCLPAHDEADEIVGLMLGQVLEGAGYFVQVVSATALPDELDNLIGQRKAAVVCVSGVPPAAARHARHLCNRIRGRFPHLNMVVGLWNAKGDPQRAKARIGSGQTIHLAATLKEAQERVLGLQPT